MDPLTQQDSEARLHAVAAIAAPRGMTDVKRDDR